MKIKYLKLKNWLLLSTMSLLGLSACHCHKSTVSPKDNEPKAPTEGIDNHYAPMYGVPMKEYSDNDQPSVNSPKDVEQEDPREPQVTVYGVPTVDFAVKGKVVDSKGRPVRGVQVFLVGSDIDPDNLPTNSYWQERLKGLADTTDAKGSFEVSTTDRPWEKVRVMVRDIDGAKNGSFADQLVDVEFGEPENDGESMSKWRLGVKKADVTVKLKNKK